MVLAEQRLAKKRRNEIIEEKQHLKPYADTAPCSAIQRHDRFDRYLVGYGDIR
jgi:hypothetical protein